MMNTVKLRYKDLKVNNKYIRPAKLRHILLYLLTFGLRGKTYEVFYREEVERTWFGPKDQFNCRCAVRPIIPDTELEEFDPSWKSPQEIVDQQIKGYKDLFKPEKDDERP